MPLGEVVVSPIPEQKTGDKEKEAFDTITELRSREQRTPSGTYTRLTYPIFRPIAFNGSGNINCLKGNKTISLAAVRNCGLLLEFVGTALQKDKEVVLAAVNNNGLALKFASDQLREDIEVVNRAVRGVEIRRSRSEYSFGLALTHAGPKIMNAINDAFKKSQEQEQNKEVVLAAVTTNGLALEHASEELRGNKEVVLAAVTTNGLALEHASKELRGNKEVVLAAVTTNGLALEHASEELRENKEVVLAAVKTKMLDREKTKMLDRDRDFVRRAKLMQMQRVEIDDMRQLLIDSLHGHFPYPVSSLTEVMMGDPYVAEAVYRLRRPGYENWLKTSPIMQDRAFVMFMCVNDVRNVCRDPPRSSWNRLAPGRLRERDNILAYADPSLLNDKAFIMKVVQQGFKEGFGLLVKYASKELREDPEVMLAALSGEVVYDIQDILESQVIAAQHDSKRAHIIKEALRKYNGFGDNGFGDNRVREILKKSEVWPLFDDEGFMLDVVAIVQNSIHNDRESEVEFARDIMKMGLWAMCRPGNLLENANFVKRALLLGEAGGQEIWDILGDKTRLELTSWVPKAIRSDVIGDPCGLNSKFNDYEAAAREADINFAVHHLDILDVPFKGQAWMCDFIKAYITCIAAQFNRRMAREFIGFHSIGDDVAARNFDYERKMVDVIEYVHKYVRPSNFSLYKELNLVILQLDDKLFRPVLIDWEERVVDTAFLIEWNDNMRELAQDKEFMDRYASVVWGVSSFDELKKLQLHRELANEFAIIELILMDVDIDILERYFRAADLGLQRIIDKEGDIPDTLGKCTQFSLVSSTQEGLKLTKIEFDYKERLIHKLPMSYATMVAMMAVMQNGMALKNVIRLFYKITFLDYMELQRVVEAAVQQNGLAFEYVAGLELSNADYLKLAKTAVRKNGMALQWVNDSKMSEFNYTKLMYMTAGTQSIPRERMAEIVPLSKRKEVEMIYEGIAYARMSPNQAFDVWEKYMTTF